MQPKAFTLYISALSSLAFLLVNLPLFVTFAVYSDDKVTFWRLLAHNPNQYLFCALFFPFVAVFVAWAGIRLNRFIEAMHQSNPDSITRYRKFFYLICLTLVYAVAVFITFFTSDPSKSVDLPTLSPDYARRGAVAYHFVLQNITRNPPGRAIQSDLANLDEWKDLELSWSKLYEQPMRELIPVVTAKTHEGLVNRSAEDLRALLDTDVAVLSNNLHKSIPYLQLVFDKRYLSRVQTAFPKHAIYDRRDIVANNIELAANAVIIGHFFMFLFALILLKRRFFRGGTSPPELVDVAKKLYVPVAMYAFWVGLRLLALQEISLVFGGSYGTIGDVFVGTILVATSGLYLTAVMISGDKIINRLANLWPLVAGFAAAVGSRFDPIRASRLFGSLADPGQLALVVFGFFLIICLCIAWVMTRPPLPTPNSGPDRTHGAAIK